jgi:hypothetical protein
MLKLLYMHVSEGTILARSGPSTRPPHGTLQVLGTVKNAVVVWLGIVFLQETVTLVQVRVYMHAGMRTRVHVYGKG